MIYYYQRREFVDFDFLITRLSQIICMDGSYRFFENVHEYGEASLELLNDGFKVNFANGYHIRLRDSRGYLFGEYCGQYGISSAMVESRLQKRTRDIFNEVVDVLLAA
jgi:hypothetical protein